MGNSRDDPSRDDPVWFGDLEAFGHILIVCELYMGNGSGLDGSLWIMRYDDVLD